MQFKPLLCVQVSGQELSQKKKIKTQTREFIFSKLFLTLLKMLPVQLQIMGLYADVYGGPSGKVA